MHHRGDLAGEALLKRAQVGGVGLLALEGVDLVAGEGGEDFDVLGGVGVADVKPELVEGVGRCVARVEPDVAGLGLAELTAIGLRDQGASQGVSLAAEFASDQLCAGGDVAPLIAATHLQATVFVLIEEHEVVTLEQLVGELGERHAHVRIGAEAFLDGVFGHHIVHGDVLADVSDEVEEGVILHPVVVVDQLGGVGRVGVKVEELGQLTLDALLVVSEGGFVEEVAFGRFHRGVTDHAGGAANKGDGPMSSALEVTEHHHADQVSDMQRIGCGINADVGRGHALLQTFFRSGHHVVDHAPPSQFFYKVHRVWFMCYDSKRRQK